MELGWEEDGLEEDEEDEEDLEELDWTRRSWRRMRKRRSWGRRKRSRRRRRWRGREEEEAAARSAEADDTSEDVEPCAGSAASHPKWNFLLRRLLPVETVVGVGQREGGGGLMGSQRGFFESLNLSGLLRYQGPWTRSDADTFVEGMTN